MNPDLRQAWVAAEQVLDQMLTDLEPVYRQVGEEMFLLTVGKSLADKPVGDCRGLAAVALLRLVRHRDIDRDLQHPGL